jgi:hypothetical protein
MQELKSQIKPTAGDLVSFDLWIKTLNRTRATGHRWRRKFPWLKTTNIFGKLYIRRTTTKSSNGALSPENSKGIFIPIQIPWWRFFPTQVARARNLVKPA